MKIKKLFLVSIFLLAVLTLGAVAASDDADNMTAVPDTPISQADDVDIISSDDASQEVGITDESPLAEKRSSGIESKIDENPIVNRQIRIDTQLWGEASGRVTYTFITDVENTSVSYNVAKDFEYDQFWDGNGDPFAFYTNTEYYTVKYFGNLTVKVDYSGDDNYFAESQTFSYFLNNTDYDIYLEDDWGEYWDLYSITYNDNTPIKIRTPYNFNATLTVTVNGKKYDVESNGTGYYLNPSIFKYGENNYTIFYGGDDVFGQFDSGLKSIEVKSYFEYSSEYTYPDDVVITLDLPDDATGTVMVSQYLGNYAEDVGGYDEHYLMLGYEKVNGPVKMVLDVTVGKYSRLTIKYDGNYPTVSDGGSITVLPKINVPEIAFVDKDVSVGVEGNIGLDGNVTMNLKISENGNYKLLSSRSKDFTFLGDAFFTLSDL